MRSKIILITFLVFLLPPIFIIAINTFCMIIRPEVLPEVLLGWPLYVIAGPIIIVSPILINYLVKKLEFYIANKDYEKSSKLYKNLSIIFVAIAIGYSFASVPITILTDGITQKEGSLSLYICLVYSVTAIIPFFIKFQEQLDQVMRGVPILENRMFPLRRKLFINAFFSVFGGIGILIIASYTLAWRMIAFPEFGIMPIDFFIRLLGVSAIIMVFQILPNVFLGSIYIRNINKIKDFVSQIDKKDLTGDINIDSRDEFGLVSDYLMQMHTTLSKLISDMKLNAVFMATTSKQLNSVSLKLSTETAKQASSAEEIASSMEEMASNIHMSSQHEQHCEEMNASAFDHMKEGQEIVGQTQKNMKVISERVSAIEEIASRTNILAINAAIEASQAGQFGRGFSVVANEVKELAIKTKDAAVDIIDLSNKTLENSVHSKEKIEDTVPVISETMTLTKEIANSSKELEHGSEQINSAIQEFNQSTQDLASGAEDLAKSSHELTDKSAKLHEAINQFKQ